MLYYLKDCFQASFLSIGPIQKCVFRLSSDCFILLSLKVTDRGCEKTAGNRCATTSAKVHEHRVRQFGYISTSWIKRKSTARVIRARLRVTLCQGCSANKKGVGTHPKK